jgi:hypothetical protein
LDEGSVRREALPTHRTTQTQNKRTQTSIPRVGFEPIIPVFEGAKTVHVLDRAVTVIGDIIAYTLYLVAHHIGKLQGLVSISSAIFKL